MSNIIRNASNYALAFQAVDITSKEMRSAVCEWYDLYFQRTAEKNEDPCQRIPYTIVQKLTKTVFSEYVATPAKEEDVFVGKILSALEEKHTEAMQMALIGGECALKPVFEKTGIRFAVVPRHNILVFGRSADGAMTDIGMMEQSAADKYYYTLLERRTVNENGYLTIRNKLFRSYDRKQLGQPVPLNSLQQYADLPEEYTFQKAVGSIGLVPLRTPMVNCVDGSSDAVSVYAAAVGLIHNININEAQLSGEFERGQSRIAVSSDLLSKSKDGKPVLADNVFVGLDEDPETVGFNIFSPTLREASFLARKQEYLRNVENVIGLKRGLLSEVEAAERTATEITSSAGDYNLSIIDFQRMWEKTVKKAMHICGVLGQLYQVEGAYEVQDNAFSIDWGNGILYDENKAWEDYKSMVGSGLLRPEIALGWRFNMPTETAEDLKAIREKYMPVAVEEEVE